MAAVRLLIVLAAVYLAVCVLLYLIQDRLIFHPRPLVSNPRAPHLEELVLQHDGVRLHGWLVNGDAPGPLIVYFGGNAEEVSHLTSVFRRLPARTALVNYRGFGASGGEPSVEHLVADARRLIRHLVERRGADRPLILFGRSLGTGIAVAAADVAEVDGMILLSPYVSLERLARRVVPFVPVGWLLRHRLDASAHLDALPERVLVFHAVDDPVIPARESRAFVALLDPPPLTVTFEADHDVPLDHPALWPHVVRFVDDSN
ncbi:MAG TPA: alpha/beta hydrolase [Pseudomonadales bacterium]